MFFFIKAVQKPITCTQLTNGPPSAFSALQLSRVTTRVFQSCLSIMGSSSNKYSTPQLTELIKLTNVCY
jgi:hypothetical protein